VSSPKDRYHQNLERLTCPAIYPIFSIPERHTMRSEAGKEIEVSSAAMLPAREVSDLMID
jgi:hypothetical protein